MTDALSFTSLVGQERAKTTLNRIFKSDRMAHDYLFRGPDGVGKKRCAHLVAARVNCSHPDVNGACGMCPSCRKCLSGNHPDLVIVSPGAVQKVGEASFAMLNDPKAGEKSYVPDLPEVISFVPVIDPGTEHVLYFNAPEKPGDYPYICTFPGHWQAMQGVLRVK